MPRGCVGGQGDPCRCYYAIGAIVLRVVESVCIVVVLEKCIYIVVPPFARAGLWSLCMLVVAELWVPSGNEVGPSVVILLCDSLSP